MLAAKLLAKPQLASNLQFVGGRAASGSSTQTPSFSLTTLSGGLASSPSVGDIVIACITIANDTNRNLQCTTAGYTEVADLYGSSTNTLDSQLGVYYKVLTAADTSVAFDLGISTTSRCAIHVWRGVNTTPLDATTTTAVNGNGVADPPSITTTTANSVVIAIGAVPDTNAGPGAPSGMVNGFSISSFGSYGIGIASVLVPSPSAYNPAIFLNGNSDSGLSALAVTMALRSS